MAGNIQTRISLVGAEEVRRAFQRIGDEGKKAFQEIQRAAQATQLDTRLNASLENVTVALRNFGQASALVGLSVANLAAATAAAAVPFVALTAAAGVAAVGVGAAFTAATKSAVTFYNELNKGATAAGTTVQNLQSLQFAAVRAGGSAEGLTGFMAKLQTELSGVQDQVQKTGFTVDKSGNRLFSVLSEETGKAATQIRVYTGEAQKAATATSDLGKFLIDAGAAGKKPEEALLKIADAFKAIPEGAEKNRIALKLFGDSAADLVPILNLGAEEIRKLQAEGVRLGLFFNDVEKNTLTKAKIAFASLAMDVQLLKAKLGTLVAPVVTQALDILRQKFEQNQQAVRRFVEDGLLRAIDVFFDFVRAFNGQEVERQWVKDTVDTFSALAEIIRAVASVITGVLLPVFRTIRDAFNGVAADINSVFGTSLSGAQLAIAAFVAASAPAIALVSAAFVTLFSTTLFAVRSFQLVAAAATLMWTTIAGGATTAATVVAASFGVGGVAALAIIAGFAAIGAAVVIYWDEIKAGAEATWTFVKRQFEQGSAGLADLWATLKSDASSSWAEIKAGADALFEAIKSGIISTVRGASSAIDGLVNTIAKAVGKLKGVFANPGDLKDLGNPGSLGIEETARDIDGLKTKFADFGDVSQQAFEQAQTPLTAFSESLDRLRESTNIEDQRNPIAALLDSTDAILTAAGAKIEKWWTVTVPMIFSESPSFSYLDDGAKTSATNIVEIFGNAIKSIMDAFATLPVAFESAFSGLAGVVQSALSGVQAAVTQMVASISAQLDALSARIQAVQAQLASLSTSSSGVPEGSGFASGGHVRGPGTGTSDSILARLSNGEFVIRADAVRKFGTQFFAMLNAGRVPGNLKMPQFNLGGAVDLSQALKLPKYATGGLVGGMISIAMPDMAAAQSQQPQIAAPTRAVTVVIDGSSFGPMIAPEGVASALVDYATRTKLRRAGAKPSWER